MHRKQYRQLAAMLANLRVNLQFVDSEDMGYGQALVDIEDALCIILKADNPRFDAMRFRDAAQPVNATSTHAVYAS